MPVMILGLLIRHALTLGAGVGVVAAQSDAEKIASAAVALFTVCWSTYQKYKMDRAG